MSNARSHVLRSVALAAVLFLAVQLHAEKGQRTAAQPSREPQRLISVTESGPVATLRLADGTSVDVAKSTLRILNQDNAGKGHGKNHRMMTTADLNAERLPAIATLIYKRDGSVRKARIQVFSSEQALTTFLDERTVRIAAACARRSSKEQNR